MELQAVTGQLYIANGEAQESPVVPGLLAQPAPSTAARGRDQDFLFVHLTISGQPDDTAVLAQDLLDTISNIFYQTSGSVTAALRKAIIESNKQLLGLNLSGATKSREAAVSCAVLRKEELFLAQAGEAVALLGHNFGIERLPADGRAHITPMGRSAGVDISYYHNWLQPGDTLLLADPRLAHLSSEAMNPVLIDTDVEDGLQALTEIIGPDSARAILIEFTDEAPGYVPDAGRPPERDDTARRLPPPIGQPLREVEVPDDESPQDWTLPGPPEINVEAVETSARKATSRAAVGLSRFTAWLATFLARLRAPQESSDQIGGWIIPVSLAVLIPLVVSAIVTGVYLQRGRAVQFGEIRQAMNQSLLLAQQAGEDAEAARTHYQEVIRLAGQAEQMRPGDSEIERLRTQALTELDAIGGIARLGTRILYQFDNAVVLASLALGDNLNGDIYVLDVATNRVYRLETGEDFDLLELSEPQTILFGDQVVGNHVVGQLLDLIWRPRGNAVTRDGIAILDSRGALVSFYPNFADTRAVALGLASDWVQPTAITDFSERLYVLDVGAETIWRYFAEGDGFSTSDDQRAIEFIDDADLDLVVDMAIYSEDGSVILLYKDGRLRRYVNGRLLWNEAELISGGLTEPLVAPAAIKIVGKGLNSSIFVLDPGSGRVVQLSLGGTFLAQFKAANEAGGELFASAADFAVAENPLRIFVVSDNKLYESTQ